MNALREPYDLYQTPPEGTRALLSVESFDGPIWEPAVVNGAIAKVLIAAEYTVVSTDLIDRGCGTGGISFVSTATNPAKHIVTNPPYGRGLADSFIRHALHLTRDLGGSVAMLLDLASLAHPIRTPDSRFCWVVWKPGHTGRPTLWWLSPGAFTANVVRHPVRP